MQTDWNRTDYELEDGSVVSGTTAAAFRSLDAIDPLSPYRPTLYSDGTTREELENFLGELRWCESIGKCVIHSNRDMYSLEDESYLYCLCEDFLTARLLWAQNQLLKYPDEKKRIAEYIKFCKKQDTVTCARNMKNSIKERLRIDVSELDTAPDMLGSTHGVISLDTCDLPSDDVDYATMTLGEQRTYDALMYKITKRIRANLDSPFRNLEHTYNKRWDEFIDEITDFDKDKADFLQRALGYSLYGGNPEKATFVLWGAKRDNGKSTLMNIIKHTLGDYADEAPAGLLLVNKYENYTAANPVLAKLVGKRIVDVSEPPLGAELNGAMVKKLASGTDAVSTRHLHREEFSYVPQFTLWMHCNALPVVKDPSAIDPHHMFVIEFTRSFSEEERDLTLSDQFKTEDGMYTVLTWLIEGYHKYLERGLAAPDCVTRTTLAWLTISKSWLQAFLDERCIISSDKSCSVTDFKIAAKAYCEKAGEIFTLKGMKKALESVNISSGMLSDGSRVYKGVALKNSSKTDSENAVFDVSNSKNCNSEETNSSKKINLI